MARRRGTVDRIAELDPVADGYEIERTGPTADEVAHVPAKYRRQDHPADAEVAAE